MSLLTVRTRFIQASGRYDLVVNAAGGNYSNNGADIFIQAGQRILDALSEFSHAPKREQVTLAAGEYQKFLQHCISADEVWLTDLVTNERIELNYMRLNEFRDLIGEEMSATTADKPFMWTVGVVDLSPDHYVNDIADQADITFDNMGLLYADSSIPSYTARNICVYPKADVAYGLTIVGKFYSRPLTADASVSYWTEQFPEALVTAAQFVLESHYRNHEASREFMEQLKLYMRSEKMEVIKQEMATGRQMEG